MSDTQLHLINQNFRSLPKYQNFGKELSDEEWIKLYFKTQEENFTKMKKFENLLNKQMIRNNRRRERDLLSLQSPTSRFNNLTDE